MTSSDEKSCRAEPDPRVRGLPVAAEDRDSGEAEEELEVDQGQGGDDREEVKNLALISNY